MMFSIILTVFSYDKIKKMDTKKIYSFIDKHGVRVCRDILNNMPLNPKCTHYLNKSYFLRAETGQWFKYKRGQMVVVPSKPDAMPLDQLSQCLINAEILVKFGGITRLKEDIKMAKIMRTMMVDSYHLNDLEAVVSEYEANIKPIVFGG